MHGENMTENRLLDAVDALTKPIRTKIIQDGPVGHLVDEQHVVTVELPPLLEQLETAIRGTIGIGGSGSLANERNMLDADALYRLVLISNMVKEWARMVGANHVKGDAGATLRAWYIGYTAQPRELDSERFYISKMQQWAKQIEEKLDPPRVRELPDRCPECRADSWWNPADKHRYLHPLVVRYKPHGPDMIQQATASCRACEASWGVRQLAYEIEQSFLRDWDEAIGTDERRDTLASA